MRKKTDYSAQTIARMILIAAELGIKLGPYNIHQIHKYHKNFKKAVEKAPLN